MPATKLTSRFCESVAPNAGRQVAYPDTLARGLELRVSGDGRKVWSLRYRTAVGRQARMTLGTFPSIDLAEARRLTAEHGGKIAGGADPAAAKRQTKHLARTKPIKTFDDLADAYLAACAAGVWRPKGKHQRERTQNDNRDVMKRHVRPVIGSMRLEEIGRPVVKSLLRDMLALGIKRQTNQVQAVIRQVYAFGIAEEVVALNPATGFTPMAATVQRTRVLTDGELKLLWGALQAPGAFKAKTKAGKLKALGVGRPVAIAMQVLALTLQRKSEVAGMRLTELDLGNRIWVIPPERMKGGRAHVVPLAPEAVKLIREAIALRPSPKNNEEQLFDFVFPSTRDTARPLRGDSVSKAMARLLAVVEIEGATVHDLRRTGATMLTSERAGVRRFIVSKVLGHAAVEGSAVTEIYDRNEYLPDKRRALTAWEGLLLEIVGERPQRSKVIQITASA